jgi:AraC-like DNA-binding protein
MEDHYQYFPVSEKDESWGLTVLNTGSTTIGKMIPYPPKGHPSHYNFNWETGRILQEYQLIYITEGAGVFESESCCEEITEGTVILLYPNERHRYRPHLHTGWVEMWVGFEGEFIDNIIEKGYLDRTRPILHIGYHETMVSLFKDIFSISSQEKPGYQPAVSGAIIYLLGLLHTTQQQSDIQKIDLAEKVVIRARIIFREKLCQKLAPEDVAKELRVGYSWFRKVFKKYTGLAPGQYLIQLKIQKAKELLADPSKLIKEIAFELNLESPLYFSKLFKEKTGLTPVDYRKLIKNHGF